MILETSQMLSSSYYDCDNKNYEIITEKHFINNKIKEINFIIYNEIKLRIYKETHKNHPCTLWVKKSLSNWNWAFDLAVCLDNERKYRLEKKYKPHKSLLYLKELVAKIGKPNIPDIGVTKFALAMNEKYKTDDPVESYRQFYLNEKEFYYKKGKKIYHTWTKRGKPLWFKKGFLNGN